MVYKLIQAAANGWRRLKGANQLPMVIEGVKFTDGVAEIDATNHAA
jgi:putative transposase